jgi:acyl phosphate:glycerol-3-phosphate acyltransferase
MRWAVPVMLLCYLIGAIPFPLLVSRWVRGIDLRQHGTGNMGATNAARVLGAKWFPIVFGLDFAKGAVATALARLLLPQLAGLHDPVLAATLGAICAVVGHCFPVYVGFQGGVGLAASAGALAVISPWLLLTALAGIGLFWLLSRNMYVGTAASALLAPAYGWALGFREGPQVAAVGVWALVVFGVHFKDVRTWWLGLRKAA